MKSKPAQTRKELMSAFDTEIEGGLSDALKNRVKRLVYKYLKAFGHGIRVAM